MKIDRNNPRHWCYLLLQACFTFIAILARPFVYRRDKKPIVVLYGHQFSGHLAAIYKAWQHDEHRDLALHYLSLDPAPTLVPEAARHSVLYCSSLKDMLFLSKASAMITDHGLHFMQPLARFTGIKFIDVGHGIPFKGYDEDTFSIQRRYYAEMWMSSQGLAEVYSRQCGCGHLVQSIGSPRTDRLVQNATQGGRFRRHVQLNPDATLILYAPTWQQDDANRTLLPFDQKPESFLAQLSAFCVENDTWFVFRSHQNASFPQAEYERIVFCPQSDYPDTEDILLDTDILISDWSSIVFDFLVLDRPTIFLDVPHPFAKGCTLGPEYRFGHIAGSMDTLIETLRQYTHDPALYLRQNGNKHHAVKRFAYDDFADGRASERGLSRLRKLLNPH